MQLKEVLMDPATLATMSFDLLKPYLAKIGETAADKLSESAGEKVPEAVGALWKRIKSLFQGKESAREAADDLLDEPDDEDNQAAFRKQLKKLLEAHPEVHNELKILLDNVRLQTNTSTIINTGNGAVAVQGGIAAGKGGVAAGVIKGNVNIGNRGE